MENLERNVADDPPYGDKGAFRKITVTISPEAYSRLVLESTRRKIAQEPNRQLSSLLREAVADYLKRIDQGGHGMALAGTPGEDL